jgi:hypothetical protein
MSKAGIIALALAAFLGSLAGGATVIHDYNASQETVARKELDAREDVLLAAVASLNAEIGALRDAIEEERQDRLTAEAAKRAAEVR